MRRIIQANRCNFMLLLREERTSEIMEKENYILSNISVCHDGDNEDSRRFEYNICSRVNMY